jgi:hypothetical protein
VAVFASVAQGVVLGIKHYLCNILLAAA